MLPSTRNPKLLFIIAIYITNIIIITLAQPNFRSYVCGNTGNYTTNSTYQTNLNTTLYSLHTTNSGFGFFNLSIGQGNNRVHTAALCQGDMDSDLCLSCLNNSIIRLPQLCPNQKEAVGYYGRCLLKYSNVDVIGNMQMEGYRIVVNVETAMDKDRFVGSLVPLMNQLKADAAAGDSLLKFATGNTTGSDFFTIYGLVQCTPDLSEMQCSDCVESAYNEYVTGGYSGRIGGTVFKPMCRYSYDVQRFYNGSTMVIPAPPPPPILHMPPPVLSPPLGKGSNTAQPIIIVIAVVTIGVIIIVSVYTLLQLRRKKQKPMPYTNNENETTGNVESLKYNFNVVRAATNNFSKDNKLGQGGFGAVYKGMLGDGREIAVKRLARDSGQGEVEFKNEVLLVAKLHHRNLVRLLGFSLEGSERLLIYEFLPNASLDHFIFDPTKRKFLDCENDTRSLKALQRDFYTFMKTLVY